MSEGGNNKKFSEQRVSALCCVLGMVLGFWTGLTVSGGQLIGGFGGLFPGLFIGLLIATVIKAFASSDAH
jgi:hypothetical protein